MKKYMMVFCLITTVFLAGGIAAAESLEDLYFPEDGKLTKREANALAMIKDWKSGGKGIKPIASVDGSIQFIYGTSMPLISCAVLQVTDIQLEKGEVINNLDLGDTVRWTLSPAITGSGANEMQHIIIKPLVPKLKTSLVISTDRRTYHIVLKSYINTYMPKVSFIYPDNLMEKWLATNKMRKVQVDKLTIKETNQNIDELDFDYKISGNGAWIPTRVYNDGIRTVIQMPKKMINGEAPSLLVIRPKTGEEVLVNYRIHKERYIVDNVFDKAILIAGVGSAQEKTTITRMSKAKSTYNTDNQDYDGGDK